MMKIKLRNLHVQKHLDKLNLCEFQRNRRRIPLSRTESNELTIELPILSMFYYYYY